MAVIHLMIIAMALIVIAARRHEGKRIWPAVIVVVAVLLFWGLATIRGHNVEQQGATAAARTPTPTATGTPGPSASPAVPAPIPSAAPPTGAPSVTTATVTEVVDGDTVKTSAGSTIRIIGIDTPETGQCGSVEATAKMKDMVLGHPVVLGASPTKDDSDRYGRLLRYVDRTDGLDTGREQIAAGLAKARYDSRDGYGEHPREADYVALDAQVPDITCGAPPPAAEPANPAPEPDPDPKPAGGCKPNYSPCVPTGRDYDCPELHDGPYIVLGPDTDRLDRDNDGVGCER